jgi:glutamate synthase domain-containing protein 2
LGLGLLFLLWLFIVDISQTKHAIRRNYPIVGRFRYWFEHMGEFFRQYFFSLDREEMPFNRSERTWVYRAAKNIDTTVAFGSTRGLYSDRGEIVFLNCLFPTLSEDAVPASKVTMGKGAAKNPYTTNSIFNISGMSYGAISKPAVQALSGGAKDAGIWMNTGEGGLSPYHLEGGCDIVYQIGTAKYGVRTEDGKISDKKLKELGLKPNVRMFEIKLSQGAKPGKGGILPGGKVTKTIAKIRGIKQGSDSISPNAHPELRSLDDILDMVNHVRDVSGKPVGFKAVIGATHWLDELFALIQKRGLQSAPDFITLDSADGGTGAAPQSLIDYMGLPIRRSLPLVVDKLCEYGLRDRIKVACSGKMINPDGVAWALCMGADFVNSARGFMFALGCIQALQCNKNTCPTGITTHNKRLQRGLDPRNKRARVGAYAKNMVKEVGIIAHSCGVPDPRLLGRQHMQLIRDSGNSIGMDELFPEVIPDSKYAS